jgi:hypothetical protein
LALPIDLQEDVLVISDLHAPFEHPDAVPFLEAVAEFYNPSRVVCIGDEVDMHALSDYDHDPDGLSPGDELKGAIKHLRPIYSMFPKVLVCTSNHTARPYRRAFKHGLPKSLLKEYREFLQAPIGWEWADSWTIDGVKYEHGEGVSGQLGAAKAAAGNMQSTVIGHLHAFAGVQYLANPMVLIFGMNVGCLLDNDAYSFAYGKHIRSKPVIGCGVVKRGIPTFIPMQLRRGGRWIGKL